MNAVRALPAMARIPALTVLAAGRQLGEGAGRALSELRVRQRLSMPALCELRFEATLAPPEALDEMAPGETLQVATQDQGGLFDGEITAVEHAYGPDGGHEVFVRGYDRLHRLRQGQHLRSFARASAASVAREVAGEAGLEVKAVPSPVRWPLLFQHHQSDLAFLVETSARCGQYLALRGRVLHLLTLAGTGAPVPLTLGEDLLEARLERNALPSRREVTASGWDPLRATAQTQIEAPAYPAALGRAEEGAHHLINESVPDREHARALAQAEADRRQAEARTLWGVAEGDSALQPGTRIEVRGVAESVTGLYVLTDVTHRIDNRLGYVCEVDSRPPEPPARPRGVTATVGVVSAVRDPGESGRVRVRLPAYGDVETGWMNVLTAGAGRGKGLIIPPAKGDTVLVLLAYEDPGQGVVLGGLYGTQRAPDGGVNALGQVRRYTWTTPDGQRIQLDDGDGSVHIENGAGLLGAGSQIDIKGGRILLRNRAGSYIELDGDQVVIAGKAIDFRSR
jgi:phage baseplate assembly protein gpV